MKQIISYIILLTTICTITANAVSYTDMTSSHDWAKEAIEQLTNQKIFEGYPDGSFQPDRNITRAELCKLIILLFGNGNTVSYSDVATDQWYYDNISKSGGYFLTEETFSPERSATREEVAYAVYAGMNLTESPTDKSISFKDQKDITLQYLEAVKKLTQNGILTGYPDETFRPTSNITRAETAAVLYRSLQKLQNKDNEEESSDPSLQSRNYFFIITKVSTVLDEDGELSTKVTGYQDGNLCELIIPDNATIDRSEFSRGTTLKPGDLIDYYRTASGRINRVSVGLNLSELPQYYGINLLKIGNTTVRRVVYGTVLERYKKGIELKAINGSAKMLYNLSENPIVYLWKNNKLQLSDINEIQDSRYETGDTVLAYCYEDTLSTFIIIK